MASLFDKLRNLMSGNVIVRRANDGKGLKVADVNNFQAFGNVQTNFLDYRGMNTMGGYHSTVGALRNAELSTFGIQRPMLFRDYELMEMDTVIGAALDIVADEMTARDEFGDVVTIKTEDEEIKKILNNLFVDILNIDFNLWPWVRSLLKYGDFYLKLDIAEKYGIVNVYPLPVYEVLREEGWDPNDPNAVRFTLNGTLRNTSQYYEDYEVAHFRLLADSNFLPYGKSYIETVRRTWKQLCLHEDTKIWLPDGSYKLIKNIKTGDSVISFDYNTNSFKTTIVKNAMKTGREMTYEVSTAHRKIRATADHKLMVADGTYKRVDELTWNDDLVEMKFENSDRFLSFENNFNFEKIISIEECEVVDVYDFEVDDDLHNFIADGIVSSNCLLEDAMLIHRIIRAPEKRIYKIDTGNTPNKDIPQLIQSIAAKMKKVPYVDPRTGDYNLKYNIQNITEDLFLPVSGGDSGTSVETLSGLQWDSIADIEYLQNKLLSGLKIPKAYLGYVNVEGGSGDGKSIAAQDVRFARTIERFQRCVLSELTKIAIIHLYSQGIQDERMVNFELSLTMPSTIYEQEKIALWQEKINLARDAKDVKMFSMDWIYKNIFNFTETEILEMQKQVVEDGKTFFRMSQIENEGNDPFKTHMTFGTPHDLAMLQKGKLTDTDGALGLINKKTRGPEQDEEQIDFGDNNFRFNLTGNENITDSDVYDIEYNKNKRQDPRSKYGQDSHIRGRDPLNKKSLQQTKNVSKLQKIRDSFDAGKSKRVIAESLKNVNIEEDDFDDDLFLSEDNKINE